MSDFLTAVRSALETYQVMRRDGPTGVKAAVTMVVPTWSLGRPQDWGLDFESLSQQGFERNTLIYACITTLASSASEAPPEVVKTSEDGQPEPVANHPLVVLLSNPNPQYTGFELIEDTVSMLYVAGNAYWEKERSKGGKVMGLWPLRPDRIKVIPSDTRTTGRWVDGYEYTLGEYQTVLKPEDVVHFRLPRGRSPFYGVSPIAVAAGLGDLDNAAVDWARMFFVNAAIPAGLLMTKSRLSEADAQRLKSRWKERFSSADNWHDIGILDADASYERVGANLGELVVENLTNMTETRICCVPGTLVVTRRGLLPIEAVRPGDQVVTHQGRWRPVTEVHVNPVHDAVVQVEAKGLDPLLVTGNHPVYAAEYGQSRSHRQAYQVTTWKAARDLRPKQTRGGFDALTVPVLDVSEAAKSVSLTRFVRGRRFRVWVEGDRLVHGHPAVTALPARVPLAAPLGRLLGFYLAEGCTGGGKVCFYFHTDETDYQQMVIDDLAAVFGVTASRVPGAGPNVTAVVAQNAMLTEFFACGTAKTKRLPEWAWEGGEEFLAAMLWAWSVGDGSDRDGHVRVTTRSQDLAWQMRLIAIACGHEASVRQYDHPGGPLGDRTLPPGIDYTVAWQWQAKSERRGVYRLDGPHLTSPVQAVTPVPYEGLVYNLEVADDESYLTTGGMVHNCQVFGVPPILVGANVGLARSTFSNYAEARKALWQETLVPLYKRMAHRLTTDLLVEFPGAGDEVGFDFGKVEALHESEADKWTRAQAALAAGVITVNEARGYMGFAALDKGDVLYLPSTVKVTPLDKLGEPEPDPNAPAPAAGGVGGGQSGLSPTQDDTAQEPSSADTATPTGGPGDKPAAGGKAPAGGDKTPPGGGSATGAAKPVSESKGGRRYKRKALTPQEAADMAQAIRDHVEAARTLSEAASQAVGELTIKDTGV